MALLSLTPADTARYAPGSYHTDGRRLLRIDAGANRELRQVEDCHTLEVETVPLLELQALGLRPIETQSHCRDEEDPS
jgi:hypothetical protein